MSNESEKIMKRYWLNQNIKKRIKIAVMVIAAGILVFILISLQWQKYQEKIDRDKTFIQNHNQQRIYDALRSLEDLNQIMGYLVFGMKAPTHLISNRHSVYQKLYDLSYFYYDRERYTIDRFALTDLFQMQREAIEYGLKADTLSDSTKAGLASLMMTNQNIIDDLQNILKVFIYDEPDWDKKNLKTYLYFYKGEILYLFANAAAVYGADLDFSFITYEPVKELDDPYKAIKITKSMSSHYSDQLSQIIRGERVPFVIENEGIQYDDQDMEMNQIQYMAQDGSEDKVQVFSDGLIYELGIDLDAIKRKGALTMDEVVLLADTFIESLPQENLRLAYSNVYNNMENRGIMLGAGYNFSYRIQTDDYKDEGAHVSLMYHESGALIRVFIQNLEILDGTYDVEQIQSNYLSKKEALEALPEEKRDRVHAIVLNTSSEAWYELTLKEYDINLIVIVDAVTGEIIRIE